MALPHRIATLLYCFDEKDRVLLIQRTREPNAGLWSPPGGKLDTFHGESPYVCGCREAREEMGINLEPKHLRLTGIVSETGYFGQAHWLMFLFEVKLKLGGTPPRHPEGVFAFHTREALATLPMPQTDRESIWPLFWRHRGGFFAAHCETTPHGPNLWTLEETKPA